VSAAPAPPKPIDPAAIERELSDLWRAEAEVRKRDGRPLARTLLLNLIVFAPDEAALDRARDVVVALTGRQPARAILVAADERSPEAGIDAWVSLYCTTPLSGSAEVCGEHITLTARGTAILDLPGTILPLLLTDVPVFLWWQSGDPLTHPAFGSLARAVDRVILDSLTLPTPMTTIGHIAQVFADAHFPAILSDLSWARLATWRYLTAQIFDPQAVRPYLNAVTRARILYYEGPAVMAWLFGGWLASRLEWKPLMDDAAPPDAGRMQFAGGQTIELAAAPLGVESPGYLAGVHLTAHDGATFEVMRLPGACAMTRVRIGELQTERVVPVHPETPVDWLGHELNRLTRAATYEAAVRLIARETR
jgi:glucose-6-phosphate dehydrogenase assembly protein OpcA